jgi:hypothetical protein
VYHDPPAFPSGRRLRLDWESEGGCQELPILRTMGIGGPPKGAGKKQG